ncbi:MAG: hypothetical protein GC147_07305 [Porphyrobacter sp.]|nr:hypothetical protein [Porphyrobacter sp.]
MGAGQKKARRALVGAGQKKARRALVGAGQKKSPARPRGCRAEKKPGAPSWVPGRKKARHWGRAEKFGRGCLKGSSHMQQIRPLCNCVICAFDCKVCIALAFTGQFVRKYAKSLLKNRASARLLTKNRAAKSFATQHERNFNSAAARA